MTAMPLREIFARDGPFSSRVRGFQHRDGQLEMAEEIARTIAAQQTLVAEAGTGTGKTFAYLVPAILGGGKVIISTGTKTLQDQLYDRDLPTVRRALSSGVIVALLKGRANYVCLQRLERAQAQATLATREEASQLRRIAQFAAGSNTGDRADLADVSEDAPAWLHATSTRDNCLGQQCAHYRECFVMRARRNAMQADIVVVNHHLFFADVALRDEGVAELLPACNTVIFDEAHQLPETARVFFGSTLSTSHLLELARDVRLELAAAGGAAPDCERRAQALDTATRELRLSLGRDARRLSWVQVRAVPGFDAALGTLASSLKWLDAALAEQAPRSEGLQACARRTTDLRERLARLDAADGRIEVRWVEVFSQAAQLQVTPLSAADPFRRQMQSPPRAWVFVSATLAVADDFTLFVRELGLDEARTHSWPSPFDYRRQALLCVPQALPADPNLPEHTEAVVDAAWRAIRASRGRAFLLFTSLRALRRAQPILEARMQRDGEHFPMLVQGTGSRSELLNRFRTLGNAVLLGSQSFWEGVDVRGEALSLVVIDKLPFASPDDPVLAACIDAARAAGGNPFRDLQLPRAILQLKQGAGRLIRDVDDRGVLMICDARLFTRAYGRQVRAGLPPMPVTRDLGEVEAFFG